MSELHILDGAESIGGNKLLLVDGGTRLLFDYGCNYDAERRYLAYDPTIKSWKTTFERTFSQLRKLDLLPELPGAPGAHFIRFVNDERQYELLPDPGVHGIFLTHAHHDHMGNIPYLSPAIPLYGTIETLCFFRQAWIRGGGTTAEDNPKNTYNNNEHWRWHMAGHHAMEEAAPVTIGQTRVTAVRVDHSIPGACGYLIETSDGKRIAITGDFRLHGTNERRKLTEHFIDVVRAREVDLLVVEGTNINEYSAVREEVVDEGWSIKAFIKHEVELAFERGGMVIVGVSGNNIERIDSIYEIVRELGARLYLSIYNASVLERLRQTGAFSESTHVTNQLLDADHVTLYERYSGELKKKFPGDIDRPYRRLRIEALGRDPALQQRAVMLLYDGDLGLLTQIEPVPGSKYIRSTWEPFNDEQLPDFQRLRAWHERYNMSYHPIHASGHAYASHLKAAIRAMNPRRVVPIHTEEPRLFLDVLPGEGRVQLVKNGSVLVAG